VGSAVTTLGVSGLFGAIRVERDQTASGGVQCNWHCCKRLKLAIAGPVAIGASSHTRTSGHQAGHSKSVMI
jgi:hypothetical protein